MFRERWPLVFIFNLLEAVHRICYLLIINCIGLCRDVEFVQESIKVGHEIADIILSWEKFMKLWTVVLKGTMDTLIIAQNNCLLKNLSNGELLIV